MICNPGTEAILASTLIAVGGVGVLVFRRWIVTQSESDAFGIPTPWGVWKRKALTPVSALVLGIGMILFSCVWLGLSFMPEITASGPHCSADIGTTARKSHSARAEQTST